MDEVDISKILDDEVSKALGVPAPQRKARAPPAEIDRAGIGVIYPPGPTRSRRSIPPIHR